MHCGEKKWEQSNPATPQPHAPSGDPSEAQIAIENLDFYYGNNRALKGINLKLPERQVTGMIGPSGCGKSTLLRVLNRMYDLYPNQRAEGKVMMDGQNIIDPALMLTLCVAESGWCSRSQPVFQCRCTTISRSA